MWRLATLHQFADRLTVIEQVAPEQMDQREPAQTLSADAKEMPAC